MLSTDVKDMPEFFQTDEFEGRSMKCKKLDMLPIECIVEGCPCPGWYPSSGQNLELSGVSISSPSTTCPFSSSPNSKISMGENDIKQEYPAMDKLGEECGVMGVYDFDGGDVGQSKRSLDIIEHKRL